MALESVNAVLGDVDLLAQQMIEKAHVYLSDFKAMLDNSTTINDLLPVSFKERIHSLLKAIPSLTGDMQHPKVIEAVHFLNSFITLAQNLDSSLSTECLDVSQNLVIA